MMMTVMIMAIIMLLMATTIELNDYHVPGT